MRTAAKVDRNQPAIVAELRKLGFDVDHVHQVKNLYDLVVTGVPVGHKQAAAVRVEVKMPGGALTEGEQGFWDNQLHPDNLIVAESAEDVLRWFGWIG